MSLPKAVLCVLPGHDGLEEESKLRSVGFATATLNWSDIDKELNSWTQLLEILNDESICAWVIVGFPESYSADFISKISLLSLALERKAALPTCFILKLNGISNDFKVSDNMLPPIISHIKIYTQSEPFAGKLMAARFKAEEKVFLPFFIKAHLSSLIGIWLEIGPLDNNQWSGFMFGVTNSVIDVLGVGPKGIIPKNCCLEFPMLNIIGDYENVEFNACAAKNKLDGDTHAYIRLNQCPDKLLISDYPQEQLGDTMASILAFN